MVLIEGAGNCTGSRRPNNKDMVAALQTLTEKVSVSELTSPMLRSHRDWVK